MGTSVQKHKVLNGIYTEISLRNRARYRNMGSEYRKVSQEMDDKGKKDIELWPTGVWRVSVCLFYRMGYVEHVNGLKRLKMANGARS